MNVRSIGVIPGTDRPNRHDDKRVGWGRQQREGLKIGRYLQSPPLIFTADHHPVWLADMYRGRTAFLICGGPSFAQLDHNKLRWPGVLTMAVNNAVKTFRPNLWVSADSPDHFLRSIWLDPTIVKFVPITNAQKHVFDSDAWEWVDVKVCDCPGVFYFRRNEHFKAAQFLYEDSLNWGNHRDFGGGRSVMLPAIRLLFILGLRRVFLLGCDMAMNENKRYHFDQARSSDSIKGNNTTYAKLNEWFKELRPFFEAEGFEIFNCNPGSCLKAFDHVEFEQAIEMVLDEWGNVDVAAEKTDGLYDTRKPTK